MYYISIIQLKEDPTLYKISYSDKPRKSKSNINTKTNSNSDLGYTLKTIFELEIDKSINILTVETIIHDYLKKKGYWIKMDWFNIPNDDEVVYIAQSIMTLAKKEKKELIQH